MKLGQRSSKNRHQWLSLVHTSSISIHIISPRLELRIASAAVRSRPISQESIAAATLRGGHRELTPQFRNRKRFSNDQRTSHSSSALDMTESLLGLGWKSPLLLCWCEEGRISAASARFTRSPSTPRILTSEFVMADLRALRRFGEYGAAAWEEEAKPLWRLQRKEPGCVVGEHMQVRFCCPCLFTVGPPVRGATEIDRFGEIDRSMENRTDDDAAADDGPHKLTRVGEAER